MSTTISASASDHSAHADSPDTEVRRDNAFNKRSGLRRGPRAPQRDTASSGRSSRSPGNRSEGSRKPPTPLHPTLAQLAEIYPQLFGQKLMPLKRGVLQELQALHGEFITKEDLKLALTLHTRSTRYLAALASGQARHDLQGQAVEPVSPEHRYHALTELYRRRQQRSEQDLSIELRQRIIEAAQASGLSPADYATQVRSKDEAANVHLDQAIADWNERIARDEARLRAFEASGKTVKQFAEMYGLNLIETAATLNRARHHRTLPVAPPTAALPEA